MRHHSRNLTLLLTILIAFALCSGPTFFDERAQAQDQKSGGSKESSNLKGSEPTKNPDGSTTTTRPNDTYAKGGTKETTVDKDGTTVTKEEWREKNEKPIRAKGKDGIRPVEIEWRYDEKGRLKKAIIEYGDNSRSVVQKEYKDDDDTEGTTVVGVYSTWDDEVIVVTGASADNVKKF